MLIAIMQPTYLPWQGYFDLIDQADTFVFLDQVEFSRQSWQQRNRIKTDKGLEWLTVSVLHTGRQHQLLSEVEINPGERFARKHLRAIENNYSKVPYFQKVFAALSAVLNRQPPLARLVDLNIALITSLCQLIGITTPLVRSSSLGVSGKRTTLLTAICQKLGATDYLSPMGSADYLLDEMEEFKACSIPVRFHNYTHPTYAQRFSPFAPFASVIDLVFNEGDRSLHIIRSGRGPSFTQEEVRHRMPVKKGNE